mmetsp:Transcript_9187/g.15970  ORF Transcript_9187/g.15970 Transcript_9187/m.15970 type:complete len:412 (+) Transcript_9187:129-1364(+)
MSNSLGKENEQEISSSHNDRIIKISKLALLRAPQREVEALVGGALLMMSITITDHICRKKIRLVSKSVYLHRCNYTMHYLEREALLLENDDDDRVDDDKKKKNQQPTLLFYHGISQTSSDFMSVIADWDIPQHIRILVPEQMGHGKDTARARKDPDGYVQHALEKMVETSSEFLDVVEAGSNCNVFGISLGGAVAYYLHNQRPDKIKRAVLLSPAIATCVNKHFIQGIVDGTNNFVCVQSRKDVKVLMRDLSTGRDDMGRKKKDPVPKFFLEALYRRMKRSAPEGHFKALMINLLEHTGLTLSEGTLAKLEARPMVAKDANTGANEEQTDNPFAALTDGDENSHRLVLWPEKDQIISHEEGKRFFENSITTRNTQLETIPDCGHLFHADGTDIMKIIRNRAREFLLNFESL